MRSENPTFWASVALLILLLGIAAIFGLMGWNAAGLGSDDVGLAGAFAMVGGVIAGVVLCVGLLTVVFSQRRSAGSGSGPVISPRPPKVAPPEHRSESPVWDQRSSKAQESKGLIRGRGNVLMPESLPYPWEHRR
ncbi:MAG: hypothetical protein IKE60_24895 [Reyranella sp.]|jgi:hypothetical protein|uniref:hypothetical protein n=1 Tax=Reyranella sp. TaxID=1929291 RepID=UPI0025D5F896|nr:hypothetical protein [Reyranella sp.]MBR2817923.1 hypothetical protein [Reyranella sp.]